uniref:Syndecan n=1 Tax=Oncorhynchus kisutch TaxID=8019 RepID=A0A8C7GH01_ONCKI
MERERERERERDREREREKERERERERERQREIERERERERERARAAQTTISPRGPAAVPMATTSTATPLAESVAPSSGVQDLVTTEEEDEDVYLSPDPTTSMPMETTTEEEEEEEVTTTDTETTPLPKTTAPPTTIGPALTERSSSAPFRPSVLVTTPIKAAPTERSTRPQQPSTTMNNELGVNGPSGDFEIREEDRRQGNEVVGRGLGMETGAEPDLIGNTINTGSSAAQLPQKNILERKEVLIAVIVGGVVGALFAAFLVMLLVYRMKKKDEGSYTLEEPKQATVTYQKLTNRRSSTHNTHTQRDAYHSSSLPVLSLHISFPPFSCIFLPLFSPMFLSSMSVGTESARLSTDSNISLKNINTPLKKITK